MCEGNVDLLYLVVSCVDASQIQTLVCHIVARDFIMFKKDSFQPVLTVSLSWETFEQYALWQVKYFIIKILFLLFFFFSFYFIICFILLIFVVVVNISCWPATISRSTVSCL